MIDTPRICSRCHANEATSNGYCKSCNSARMNAQRKSSDNVARQPDTYALASQLGISLDVDTCMLVDSLTDTQAILLLEKLEGKEKAHCMMDELVQRMQQEGIE